MRPVSSLSLSAGYVTRREFAEETILDMAKIADKRMYQAKSAYYSKKGVDRRGQAAANTALCNLYTKILKINITEDYYSIITMLDDEKVEEKGYADSIFKWFADNWALWNHHISVWLLHIFSFFCTKRIISIVGGI